MALKFNTHDKIWYGSQTDVDNDTEVVTEPTAKAFAYGDATTAGKLYVSNGTIWTLVE